MFVIFAWNQLIISTLDISDTSRIYLNSTVLMKLCCMTGLVTSLKGNKTDREKSV